MRYLTLILALIFFTQCSDGNKIDIQLGKEFSQNLIFETISSGEDSIYIKTEIKIQLDSIDKNHFNFFYNLKEFYSYSEFSGNVHIVDSKDNIPYIFNDLFNKTIKIETDKNATSIKKISFENEEKVPPTASLFNFDIIKIIYPTMSVSIGSTWTYQIQNELKGGSKEFVYKVKSFDDKVINLEIDVKINGLSNFMNQTGKGSCVLYREDFKIKTFELVTNSSTGKYTYKAYEK